MKKFEIEYLIANCHQLDLVKLMENRYFEDNSRIDLYAYEKDNSWYPGQISMNGDEINHPGWNIFQKSNDNSVGEIRVEKYTGSLVVTYCVFDDKKKKQLKRLIDHIHSDLKFIGCNISPRFNSHHRSPRKDAIERVALAIFFKEIGDYPTLTAAAKRTHTTLQTIRDLEDDEDVIKLISLFRTDKKNAYQYRNKYAGNRGKA